MTLKKLQEATFTATKENAFGVPSNVIRDQEDNLVAIIPESSIYSSLMLSFMIAAPNTLRMAGALTEIDYFNNLLQDMIANALLDETF